MHWRRPSSSAARRRQSRAGKCRRACQTGADKGRCRQRSRARGVSGSNSSSQATNTNTTIDTTVNNSIPVAPITIRSLMVDEPHRQLSRRLPMAGQGYNFAVAAWNTGVDPVGPRHRLHRGTKGVLIAPILTTPGAGLPVAAVGNFGNWSEGISAHVAYLECQLRLHPYPGCGQKVLPAHVAGLSTTKSLAQGWTASKCNLQGAPMGPFLRVGRASTTPVAVSNRSCDDHYA